MFLKNIPVEFTRAVSNLTAKATSLSPRLKVSAAFLTLCLTVGAVWIQPAFASSAPAPTPASISLSSIADYFWSFFGTSNDGHKRPPRVSRGDTEPYNGQRQAQEPIPAAALPCTPTGVTLAVPGTYATIQLAINAANPTGGDKIVVAAGNYTEQLSINKCVTIEGAGVGTTNILSPPALTASTVTGFGGYAIVEVRGNSYVTITGVTISGPVPFGGAGRTHGIFVSENATLKMTNSRVTALHGSGGINGVQDGVGIRAGSTAANTTGILDLDNVTVDDFQKNGIDVDRTGSSATITNSTVAGIGPTAILAQNGIWADYGADLTVTHSTIKDLSYTGGPDATVGIGPYNSGSVIIDNNQFIGVDEGVYALNPSPPGTPSSLSITNNTFTNNLEYGIIYMTYSPVTITDNVISDSNVGIAGRIFPAQVSTISRNSITQATGTDPATIYFWDSGTTTTATINVSFNRISSDNSGGLDGLYNNTSNAVNAENNWWGCNAGPGGSGCDIINGSGANLVDSSPWLTLTGITADASPIAYNGTSNISGVSLCTNSDSVNVCTVTDHIIDGTPLGYGTNPATAGSVSPTSSTFVSGLAVAGTTFTAGAGPFVGDQTEAVGATLDNQTITANVVVHDSTQPTITSFTADSPTPQNSISNTFTAVFSEPVTNFTTSDVSLTGTAPGQNVSSVTQIAPNDGTTWQITASVSAGVGSQVVTIPTNAVDDTASPANTNSNSKSVTVTYGGGIDFVVDEAGINCLANGQPIFTNIPTAVFAASNGSTIKVCPGNYPNQTGNVQIAQNALTIVKALATSPVINLVRPSGSDSFTVSGSGVTVDGINFNYTDTPSPAVENVFSVQGTGFKAQDNSFTTAHPWSGGDVTRAFVISSTATGLNINNNTVTNFRQPAYISGDGTTNLGTVSNNVSSGTKGWVMENAIVTMTGNTFPATYPGAPGDLPDIAILNYSGSTYQAFWGGANALNISSANDNAYISLQFTGAGDDGRAISYVDDVATAGNGRTVGSARNSIQDGIDNTLIGGTVHIEPGTFVQEANVNRTVKVEGSGAEGANQSKVSGPIGGGDSATIRITGNNVDISGLWITREGNNTTDWNNPGLKSAGLAIQGQATTGAVIHDNKFDGLRTGIDINNSNGHTIRNNVIDNNRTGLLFRNQTDNLKVVENAITNNWTVGLLFLDASGGTNSPVQTAKDSLFINNNLSGNWYGQVVDRQAGGSLPAPGTNLKNFQGNWYGTAIPVVTTANSAEPGYAALIPVAYGGSATAPGGQPDIAGPASANVRYDLPLTSATDTNVETTSGRGTYGFQGANLVVNSAVTINDPDPRPAGWFFWNEGPNGSHGLETGPNGSHLGAGSARLSIDTTGRESFGTAAYGGVRLADITKLKFKTWTTGPDAPVLQFDVDNDLSENTVIPDATYQGRIVFQPAGTITPNTWQQWDLLAPGTLVWGSGSGSSRPFSTACPQNNPCTLASVLANNTWANLGVRRPANGGTLLFRAGGPSSTNITEFVDDFEIGIGTGNTTYDFEPDSNTAPTVTSITRMDPDPTNAVSVTFAVTFSEPVTGVDPGDFALATTGVSGAGNISVSGSGASYVVTVDTGTGSGTIRLDVNAGASIVDVANNPFVGPYTGGPVYTIDRTGPNSTVSPVADPDTTSPVDFSVNFGETVTGFDAADVTIGGTATPTGFTISGTGPYTVHVTGMNQSGTVTVSVNNAGVTDSLGNAGTGASSSSVQFNLVSTANVQTPIGGTWAYYDDVANAVIPGYDYVYGPTGGPLPAGSARLQSGANELKGLFTQDYNGTKLANITTLSYSTYVHGSATNEPTLQFNVDFDLTDNVTTYQGRVVYVPSQNGTVSADTWQNWNALTGVFWYSNYVPLPTRNECTQAIPCTLSQMLTAHPNMGIHATAGAIGFRSEQNSNSNVDNFVIGISSANTVVNFEPAGAMVSTPSSPNGWFYWEDDDDHLVTGYDYVFGPLGGPLPVGSARVASGTTPGDQKKGLFTFQYRGTRLDQLTTLKYSTYAATAGDVPHFQISVDFTGNANPGYQGRLVYVPSENGTFTANTWQTWDLKDPSAKFYYSSNTYSPSGDGCKFSEGTGCTLATILAAHPNARVMPIADPGNPDPYNTWGVIGVRTDPGKSGNIDNLIVGVNGADTTFNFEPAGTTVVSSVQMQGWETISQRTASASFRTGPGTPPLQTGSLHLTTGPGNAGPDLPQTGAGQGGKSWFSTQAYDGVKLADISSLSYSTYVTTSPGSSIIAPTLQFQVDIDGNGTRDAAMVFEPYYSTITNGGPQPDVTTGQWQNWDAKAGKWWFTGSAFTNDPGFPSQFCPSNCFNPLAAIATQFPNAKIVTWYPQADGFGAQFVAGQNSPGGPWNDFDGNVDNFVFGVNGAVNTFDFEAEPPTVSIANANATEGSPVAFTVTLTGDTPVRTVPVTVVVNTSDGTATAPGDYTPAVSQVVTFAPGVSSQTVSVATATDNVAEGDETFTATLSNAVNAGIATGTATGTINDGAGYIAIGGQITAYTGGAGIQGVTVRLTGTSNGSPINLTTTTDINGNYNFNAGISTTGQYSVAPTVAAPYVYDPESIYFINPTSSVTNANFVGYNNDNPRTVTIGTVAQVNVGDNVTVPVTLQAQGTETGLNFDLLYDDTKLHYVSASAPVDSTLTVGPGAGSPRHILLDKNSGTYSGPVTINVTFSATPGPAVSTPVSFAATGRDVSNVQGVSVPAIWTNGLVNFALGHEGDITNGFVGGFTDGLVKSNDVTRIRRLIVGLDTINGNVNEFQRADAGPFLPNHGNGCISAGDLTAIRLLAVGSLPATPASGVLSSSCREGLSNKMLQKSLGPVTTFSALGSQATPGSLTNVSVEMEALGTENALGFTFNYDTNVFDPSQTVASAGETFPLGGTLTTNPQPGRIGILIDMPSNQVIPAGTRIIVTISLRVRPTAQVGTTTPISFTSDLAIQDVSAIDTSTLPAAWNDGIVEIINLVPTAATSSVGGQVRTADGRGIGNTVVTLTGTDGSVRRALTNQMGYYRIDNVPTGATYVLGATSKRFTFDSRVVTVGDNITDADITPRE